MTRCTPPPPSPPPSEGLSRFLSSGIQLDEDPDPRWEVEIGVMFTEPGEPGYYCSPPILPPGVIAAANTPPQAPPAQSTNVQYRVLPTPPFSPITPPGLSPSSQSFTLPNDYPERSEARHAEPSLATFTAATTQTMAPQAPSSARPRKSHTPSAPQNTGSSKLDAPNLQANAARTDPYYTTAFPPGRDLPGFVPFGEPGVASAQQGNYPDIDIDLRTQILAAETDARHLRGFYNPKLGNRLTYQMVTEKYNAWNKLPHIDTLRTQVSTFVRRTQAKSSGAEVGEEKGEGEGTSEYV